jgi:F-type H+-transporting ATPase subunit a
MAVIIIGAFLVTRKLQTVPKGRQVFVEGAVGFLNNFSKEQFGRYAGVFAPFIGCVFIFLLGVNFSCLFSPIEAFGFEPPFAIKPPSRDINFAAAFAVTSILVVLVSGLIVKRPGGWLKGLFKPMPLMLPFNLLEYIIRPLSLCLRLFGNILGGLIVMRLIEIVVPLFVPSILSIYFDLFDGFIQALVFTFLTALFISEAVGEE